ncbi:MAG: histidine kinase [Ilumatobacteraceae bacterium]|nr:histidine kinase [Ilumatobacteraceae bacterium]
MRRRITEAIIGVTAVVLVVLGIPLAVIAQQSIVDSELVRLQATAAHLLTEIDLPIDAADLDRLATESDAPPPFGIYDTAGRRVYGVGPETADGLVSRAEDGVTSSRSGDELVVAAPITDGDENVLAVVRVSRSLADAHGRAHRQWLVMAAAGAVALGLAWLLARRVAARLGDPVTALASQAALLGSGRALADHRPTGIEEVDLLGAALTSSARQIHEAIARERRFSADVSHQLRTPLAGMRLRLERAQPADDVVALADASLGDLERLEQTVSHLLAFARDATPTSSVTSVADAVDRAVARWDDLCSSAARSIVRDTEPVASVRAASASIDQVLDVLVDNALHHGAGTITVRTRSITGGVAVDVCDEGSITDTGTDDELFARGHGSNTGIGLALARSIAEAEDARLLVTSRGPTTFSLILLAAADGSADAG